MPIVRTWMCEECGHQLKQTLSAEQWDSPAPACPECYKRQMQQQFVAPAIVGQKGQARAQASKLAQEIAAEDYHVADMQSDHREGDKPKVRYKTPPSLRNPVVNPSSWQGSSANAALETAMALGRANRLAHGGDGLDTIKSMPDLIAASKRRSMKIW